VNNRRISVVLGVELNHDSVRNAIQNSKIDNMENVFFINEDAEEYMVKRASKGESVDLVIMDPPREDSDGNFLSSLVKFSPKKIVYISCNPETQKRDLDYLLKFDYKVKEIQPVDMFPMTEHVEVIVKLEKQ
jgi:23S rRNA (uracil1939-C5)-methyltransferase